MAYLKKQILNNKYEVRQKHDACQAVGERPLLARDGHDDQNDHSYQNKYGNCDAARVHRHCGGALVVPLG
jgi:hypothetical protein